MLTAITAAVVGVILNLAVWFAIHAIHPAPGKFDWFLATTAVAAWVAIQRFKVNLITTLAGCAALGMVWKLIVT